MKLQNSHPVLVLDMDGVVVHRDEVFSIRFSKKYGVPIEDVLPFFKNEFQLCLTGKRDIKKEIVKYFPRWNFKGSVDELLDFWFLGENKVDKDIIGVVNLLRKRGAKVYVATNNEKYRVEYLSDKIGLKDHFDAIYSSADLGVKKPDMLFFKKLVTKIGKKNPQNVFFCDNDEENIKGARSANLQTHFYKGITEFRTWIERSFE